MKSYIEAMEPRMMEGLALAKSLGASGAYISFSHNTSRGLGYAANRLKNCLASESMGYGITIILKGRVGTASGNIPEALPDMVRRAAVLAQTGAVSHFDEYPQAAAEYKPIRNWSDSVFALTDQRMVEDGRYLVDGLLSADKELVANAGITVVEDESLSVNTGGFHFIKKYTMWILNGGFQKTTGSDMLFGGDIRVGQELNGLYDLKAILDANLFDLEHARRIVTVESGTLPVYLPPDVLARFLKPVVSGINGRNVFMGTSPLKDKLGTQCFSPAFTLVDDPHRDFSSGSAACDGVGIPTQRRVLVENGVLKTFLYSYDTAKLCGQEPTGNDGDAPYDLVVQGGAQSSDEMLKSIRRGIYVKNMIGFGQTNIANGDFSANLGLAYLVENGEIIGRVKNVMIGGNIFELLAGDVQFSSDMDYTGTMPYAIIPGVGVRA